MLRRTIDMRSATAPGHESRSAVSDPTSVVFVVDDDVSVRESLEALIRCQGWRPEVFQSAEEFLARPRLIGPSCLILDVTLPDLNGLELQKTHRRSGRHADHLHHGLRRRADDGGGD